jgi:myo-inositol-1(or 4)-monophosphatase
MMYLQTALNLAKESGGILRKFWGNLQDIRDKEIAGDLVTEADKESDRYILGQLQKIYPTHSVLTEESGEHAI